MLVVIHEAKFWVSEVTDFCQFFQSTHKNVELLIICYVYGKSMISSFSENECGTLLPVVCLQGGSLLVGEAFWRIADNCNR